MNSMRIFFNVQKELESEDEGSEKGGRRRRSGVPVPIWKSRRSDTESTLKTRMMALYNSLVQYKASPRQTLFA